MNSLCPTLTRTKRCTLQRRRGTPPPRPARPRQITKCCCGTALRSGTPPWPFLWYDIHVAAKGQVVKAMAIIQRPRDGALLVSEDVDPSGALFHRPLGGHVEFGEYAVDTVQREFLEEIGQVLTVLVTAAASNTCADSRAVSLTGGEHLFEAAVFSDHPSHAVTARQVAALEGCLQESVLTCVAGEASARAGQPVTGSAQRVDKGARPSQGELPLPARSSEQPDGAVDIQPVEPADLGCSTIVSDCRRRLLLGCGEDAGLSLVPFRRAHTLAPDVVQTDLRD